MCWPFSPSPRGDGLLLTGPTGSGKTSLVLQVAARLNWPVQEVTCHGRMELTDLIGQFMLLQGETRFVHGPLATAAREGHLLVLNEMDILDAAELAGLNDIVEGAPLVIAANGGEVIRAHPKFRLIATGNSAGAGDTTGLYQGVLRQNLAFLDRFRVVEVGYPEAETETGLLKTLVPSLPAAIGEKMVAVANEVRRLFLGQADGGTGAHRHALHPHPGALGAPGLDLQGGAPAAGLCPRSGVDRPGGARAAGGDPADRRRCVRRPLGREHAVTAFALYRYTHPDGSAKEWAWGAVGDAHRGALGTGRAAGAAGALSAQPAPNRHPAGQRQGGQRVLLCRSGRDRRQRTAAAARNREGRHVRTAVTPAGPRAAPPIDLARLETGGEDFWF